MSSELSLYFAGVFLSYSLQVAVAYIACRLVNRVLSRPSRRFAVWMTFLAASGGYWMALAGSNARLVLATADRARAAEPTGPATAAPFVVPLAWGPRVLAVSEVFAALYVVIVLLLTTVSFWRSLRLRLVLRHARPASRDLVQRFEATCHDLGISRCELAILPGITSPATVGWLRPRVLLPTVCEEIGSTPRLAGVVHHELAHVARRDYLWAGLSELFCHLLFFHPAVWRARKLMLLERELACDCAVVEARPDHRADYADSLAYFVRLRMLEEKAQVGLDFATSASSLGRRVRFILAGPPRLPWWNRASRATAGFAVMSAFVVVAPALTVFLAFARPLPATAPRPAQTAAARTVHHKLRSGPADNATPIQNISRIQAQPSARETSVYSRNGGHDGGSELHGGTDNRAWRELDASLNRPTVSDVVRDAVTILRPGPERDRERERNPRLTH